MTARVEIGECRPDTPVTAMREGSRRELVCRGVALGGAMVAAGSISALTGVRDALARAEGDEAILEAAVRLELEAAFAYDTMLEGGRFDAPAGRLVRLFRDQERDHAAGLTTALRNRGGRPPAAPRAATAVPGLAEAAGGGRKAMLTFAAELEMMAVAAYSEAIGKLEDPILLSTTASIMANEGQHLAILRQQLGQNPVPNAFETGRAVE